MCTIPKASRNRCMFFHFSHFKSVSSCTVAVADLCASNLFHSAIGLPTINILLQKASVPFLPSLHPFALNLACWLLFPPTTVCTNGWLSIFHRASAPRCMCHAGMMKTLSCPLTQKEPAPIFHLAHGMPLIAFMFHVNHCPSPSPLHPPRRDCPSTLFPSLAAVISSAHVQLLVQPHPQRITKASKRVRIDPAESPTSFATLLSPPPVIFARPPRTLLVVMCSPLQYSPHRSDFSVRLHHPTDQSLRADAAVGRRYRSRSHTLFLLAILLTIVKRQGQQAPQSSLKDER